MKPAPSGLAIAATRHSRHMAVRRQGVPMIKISKKKTVPKAANQNEVPLQAADTNEPDLAEMVGKFAPKLEVRAISDLKVNPRNARKHSPRQIQQLCASL